MYLNLGEQLTIDDMARTALFSKFHFSRVFRQVTGVSPGRFLSALRLQEAKRLLISTTMTVADISNQVGYTSVGTFSSRFKSSVGLAPSLYRQRGGVRPRIPTDPRRNDWGTRSVSVGGRILHPEDGTAGTVFVGLFPEPIPQGSPIRCTVLDGPGRYRLDRVPQGTWYVLAHSLPDDRPPVPAGPPTDEPVPWVGSHGPISIAADTVPLPVDVQLRPMRMIDPPVLLALTDIRTDALNATTG
ncbi:helix-turn-helix transcriptional regulator [Spirillospora sp. NPDC049024]